MMAGYYQFISHLIFTTMNTAQELSKTAQAAAKIKTEKNSIEDLYNTVLNGIQINSEKKVKNIISKCEQLADQSYGSVLITLCNIWDLYHDPINGYSAKVVQTLLKQQGFELKELDDHYDATTYLLVWDDSLPEAATRIRTSI
jgi:hypothetical protein